MARASIYSEFHRRSSDRTMPHPVRLILLAALLAGCQSISPEALAPLPPDVPPVRFLLTFDDGPSILEEFNPTLAIHEQLASNPVQPGIKAIFFVQTRNRTGGGTDRGKQILRQAHAAGHVIGLHSGSARGHIRHTKMPPAELAQSLVDGKADIVALTGELPRFVRPTFWGHNETTRRLYAEHGFDMLLTDINGADGFSSAYHTPLNRFGHLRADLAQVRAALARGDMPAWNGYTPLVVTFHDLNIDTAEHLTEYLALLVDEARRLGMPLADKPFYDRAPDVTTVAALRTTPPDGVAEARRHWAARKHARAGALVPATAN
jgi:peptidoglycan/xylan/chitin deacetylase (PgdA/CDA1 family)